MRCLGGRRAPKRIRQSLSHMTFVRFSREGWPRGRPPLAGLAPPDGIVMLTFVRQPEVGDVVCCPHDAAFRTHVFCCRIARYAEASSRCRRGELTIDESQRQRCHRLGRRSGGSEGLSVSRSSLGPAQMAPARKGVKDAKVECSWRPIRLVRGSRVSAMLSRSRRLRSPWPHFLAPGALLHHNGP